jgi:hypothetical protein
MDKIKKLKATVNELDKKYENELVEAISNKTQHNVDITELQERLSTETCKADIYRKDHLVVGVLVIFYYYWYMLTS